MNWVLSVNGQDQITLSFTCQACGGSGGEEDKHCPDCDGEGEVLSDDGRIMLRFLKRHMRAKL